MGLCVEGQLGGDLLAVTQNGEGHGIPGLEALLGGGQILHGGDLSVVELGDDVAQLQPCLIPGAAVLHGVNEHALGGIDLILCRHLLGHGAGGDGHIGLIADGAVLYDVFDDGLHIVDGNGEAQPLHRGIGVAGVLGGHDAHHLAVQVHQGAAGVAGVNGGVHLDHVEGGALHVDGTVHAGYDALTHGEGQLTQRVADGHHGVAHVDIGGAAQRYSRQILGIDFQHSHIVVAVAAHQRGRIGVAVIEGDVDGAGVGYHVLIGDDIAVGGVDEAAAGGSGLGLLAEDVGGHGGAVDGHHTVDRGGVYLGGSHQGLPVYLFHADVSGGAVALLHGGLTGAAAVLGQNGAAEAAGCADNGTAEDQGHHTTYTAVVLLGLHRGVCHHRLGGGLNGGPGRRLCMRFCVGITITEVIQIVLVMKLVGHMKNLLLGYCPRRGTVL